jgi:hypothetical protein
MPRIFEDRERAYEGKWAHDEETQFKILARRNRLLGHWAAGELGLSGHEAGEYAEAIVDAGLAGKDKDRVFRKIRDDFHAKNLGPPDPSIHDKMEEFFRIVSAEMAKGLSESDKRQ